MTTPSDEQGGNREGSEPPEGPQSPQPEGPQSPAPGGPHPAPGGPQIPLPAPLSRVTGRPAHHHRRARAGGSRRPRRPRSSRAGGSRRGPPAPQQQGGWQAPPQPAYAQPYGGSPPNAPGAVTALVLGILGLVICSICAPFAWNQGLKAERTIAAEPGRYGGKGMATAGKILGIIGTVHRRAGCRDRCAGKKQS